MSRLLPTNPIDRAFIIEDQLVRIAGKFNLKLNYSPSEIGPRLSVLHPAHLDAICDNLASLVKVLATCEETGVDPWDDREFFLLSMRSMGLTFPRDFLDRIGHDDLIEGYDMNRLQTFRNMRFMEVSGYTLLEILSSEWTMLYDRPKVATETMIGFCDEILWQQNRTIPFSVPAHFIRELRSEEKRVFEITFKYLTPLFSGPDRPYGMLGTSKIELIPTEKLADNVEFI